MRKYILQRLILLPITLFVILLVNFVIINLAPGDPSTISDSGMEQRDAGKEAQYGTDDQYMMFREHYGLTLPILANTWPRIKRAAVERDLKLLANESLPPKAHADLRIRLGDKARYVMPHLLSIASDAAFSEKMREMAKRYFVRGGTRMGYVGTRLTPQQRAHNRKVAHDNQTLRTLTDVGDMRAFLEANASAFPLNTTFWERVAIFFGETRFSRYFTRIATLDFGTMRNDSNRSVVAEVASRIKVSLTLAVFPMLITFVFCQILGMIMATNQNRWPDVTLRVTMLILYAIPVFVVAPFLIEKVALPFGLPISGFHGSNYHSLTSIQRLGNISLHLLLPLIAVMYGTMAAQSRLSRTAILEVLRQDYVRTARAKGLPTLTVLVKHVGRNAAITIVTSLAASLGIILAGSLIIETIFGIDGFGRFFYEAILNRDYNVIMFSAIAGSGLALLGYLLADIAYTALDPRVRFV